MPTLLGGNCSEPPGPDGPCPAQRTRLVTGPGPDAGGSNQGNAGCVHTPAIFGIDTAPDVSLPPGPAAESVCAKAGIAAAVVTAASKRKARCINIGHSPDYERCPSLSTFNSGIRPTNPRRSPTISDFGSAGHARP